MGAFGYYLIGTNIIGFFLYLINMWLYSHTAEGQVDKFLTILSLLGGSLGILLAILIFDRIEEPLILHSDRGSQYVSKEYRRITANMQCSYSEKAYPWDNACIESFID